MTTTTEEPRSVADVASDLSIRAARPSSMASTRTPTARRSTASARSTATSIVQVAACDTADVDRAVMGARRVFDSGAWSRIAPKKRKRRSSGSQS